MSAKSLYEDQYQFLEWIKDRWWIWVGMNAILAVLYVAMAQVGLKDFNAPYGTWAIWIPAGMALAAVLLLGNRILPGVWVGSYLVILSHGATPLPALALSLAATLEAQLGGLLLQKYAGGYQVFSRVGNIFKYLLLGIFIPPLVSASLGVGTLAIGGLLEKPHLGPVWQAWVLRDMTSILLVTPLLVTWTVSPWGHWNWKRLMEALLVGAIFIPACLLILAGISTAWPLDKYPIFFFFIPLVLWIGYRFGARGATLATIILTATAIWGTLHGRGRFVILHSQDVNLSLLLVQAFGGTLGFTNLVLAASVRGRDIATQAQQASDARLRLITERTPLMLTQCNREGYYQYVNRAYAQMLNLAPEQIVARSIAAILGEEAYQKLRPHILEVLSGRSVEFEIALPLHGAESHHLHAAYVPDVDEQGQVQGWIASLKDITQRKKDQAAAQESESRFRTMGDHAPALIWISGTDKLYTWVNQPWLEFVGRSMAEELGNGWAQSVHPEDLERCLQTYWSAFDDRSEFDMEYRLRRKDGQWRWILTHGVPLTAGGVFRGYIGSGIDVTERKLASDILAQQARLLDLSHDAIFSWELGGPIEYWNQGAERLYGYTAAEARGHFSYVLLKTVFPQSRAAFLEVLTREGEWLGELEHTTRDGRVLNVETRHQLICQSDGKMLVLETTRDVTDRKKAAMELEAWQKELERRVEQRTSRLLAAHDQLRAEITERQRLETEIAQIVDREQSRLGQALHEGLAQELSALSIMVSSLDAARQRETRVPTEKLRQIQLQLGQSAQDARNLARSFYPVELEKYGMQVALEALVMMASRGDDLALQVKADEDLNYTRLRRPLAIQLLRIAQEGVANAIKHAKARRIIIELSTVDSVLTLAVKDDGVGLPPDVAERPGIGLRIMKHRARLVGGQLDIENSLTGGVQVTCRVPLQDWILHPQTNPVRE